MLTSRISITTPLTIAFGLLALCASAMAQSTGFTGTQTADDMSRSFAMTTRLDAVVAWGRKNALWPLPYGTACCGIEMMSVASAKYDFSRFGFEVARATPRQADVIIIAGTIVNKMAPVLRRLYDQMADPKYVIAMGACAISGGPFFYNTYSVVKGADHVIPVDVYIPGCPPRPEALLHALITLQGKIRAGLTREQIKESSYLNP